MEFERFIVVRNRRPFTAGVIHVSMIGAANEAERLAKKESDTFLVFQLIGAAGSPVPPVRLFTSDEIASLPCPLEVRP